MERLPFRCRRGRVLFGGEGGGVCAFAVAESKWIFIRLHLCILPAKKKKKRRKELEEFFFWGGGRRAEGVRGLGRRLRFAF